MGLFEGLIIGSSLIKAFGEECQLSEETEFNRQFAKEYNNEYYRDARGGYRETKTGKKVQIFKGKVYDKNGKVIRDLYAEEEARKQQKIIKEAKQEKKAWFHGKAPDGIVGNVEFATMKRFAIRCVPGPGTSELDEDFWLYEKAYYDVGSMYVSYFSRHWITEEEFTSLGGMHPNGFSGRRMWIETYGRRHKLKKSEIDALLKRRSFTKSTFYNWNYELGT